MSNSNNSQEQVFLTYKQTRTKRKPNGLYIIYDLSKADLMSDLYKDYIKIENKKQLQNKRRAYLIKQEKEYKMNKMEFPEWAQKELEYLRKIKKNLSLRYQRNNWALTQLRNTENRNTYIDIQQDMYDGIAYDDCDCRLQRYEEEIKLCQQLNKENQEAKKNNQEKQKKIVSKEEYERYLYDKEQKTKQRFKQLAIKKGLRSPTSMFHVYQTKTKEHINNSNTIDLDEDKMEQNQQINA